MALACLFVFLAFLVLFLSLLHSRGVYVNEQKNLQGNDAFTARTLIAVLLSGLVCALVAYEITGQLLFAILGLLAGFFVVRWLSGLHAKRQQELLRAQYAQVLNILASALQGGLSPYQAFEDAVPSMPRPTREIFTEILRKTRTGSTFVEAAEAVARESGWEDLNSLVMALKIYSKTGCNLVEVFKHLIESVYERESDRKYAGAVTAEIRTTAFVLSFLPFVMMGAARVMAPEFTKPLFTTASGNMVIILCIVMVSIGNVLINTMMKSAVGRY